MRMQCTSEYCARRGFAYAEVLLSVVLLAALLTPALQALQSAAAGGTNASTASRQINLRSKMEEVLAIPFSKLYAETYAAGGNTVSSVSILSDAEYVVVLYRYDAAAKALSGSDTGLLFVSVYYAAEGNANALNTLTGRWW